MPLCTDVNVKVKVYLSWTYSAASLSNGPRRDEKAANDFWSRFQEPTGRFQIPWKKVAEAGTVMPCSFHDIGEVEFQDNWGRVW